MNITISDLINAVDRYEDEMLFESRCSWSKRLEFQTNRSALKDAITYYEIHNDFGPFKKLVTTVVKGYSISRDMIPGLGSGIISRTFDNIIDALLDIAELSVKPLLSVRNSIWSKFNISTQVLSSKIQLNDNGKCQFKFPSKLNCNSEEQFIVLRHSSQIYYDLEQAPTLIVESFGGVETRVQATYVSYRTIAYRVCSVEGLRRCLVSGVKSQCFVVLWKDTLSPKK